tara:strand:- start:245 stop:454 length:210 start_codon:yes stop_codon:yes gene_type:complete
MPININMTKEEKIDKIMNLIVDKSSLSEEKIDLFEDVLESLDDKELSKLVAGIVFVEHPFKPKKVWRIE